MKLSASINPTEPVTCSADVSAAEDCGPANRLSTGAAAYLYPGQIIVSLEPTKITTVLGSCVSVCLWDRVKGVGGMNHYQLPCGSAEGDSKGRFGNLAMELLLQKVLDLGCRKCDLEAKLFGGACVIEAFEGNKHHLGLKNVEVARRFLANEGIPVVSEDVGEQHGRKLVFHVGDGTAWVKRLR